MSRRHKLKNSILLRVIISLLILTVLLFRVPWKEVASSIANTKVFPLLVVLLLYFLSLLLKSIKWKVLLVVQSIGLSLRKLFQLYLVGRFASNFLPTSMGGDVLRMAYVAQLTNRGRSAVTSVVVERLTGALGACAVFGFGGLLNRDLVTSWGLDIPRTTSLLIGGGAVFVLGLVWGFTSRYTRLSRTKVGMWIESTWQKGLEALLKYRTSYKALSICFILSTCSYLFLDFSVFLLLQALSYPLGFRKLILVASAVNLVGFVPLSINGWGIQEGSYVVLLGFFGVPSSIGMSVALLARALLVLASLSGGVVWLFSDFRGRGSKLSLPQQAR